MKTLKPLLASWARSFLAASVACYLAGVTDPMALFSTGIAAMLPVILRWLNPKDSAFGINK